MGRKGDKTANKADCRAQEGAQLVPVAAGKVDRIVEDPRHKALRRGEVRRQVSEMIGAGGVEAAVNRLVELMNSPDDRVALQAATNIIERVYGRPKQEIDMNADNRVEFILSNPPGEQ